VQYIGKIETWFSGNLLAELPKDIKVEISRRQASNQRQAL
jgi:two-component system LytT family response regulator